MEVVPCSYFPLDTEDSKIIYKSFYRCLQILDNGKSILAQPHLTPNQHFNCSALLKHTRWNTTGRAKHAASETDGTLWRRPLSTVSEDAFLHQPSQHHSEQHLWLVNSKCTTCNTPEQPWPLSSFHLSSDHLSQPSLWQALHTSQPMAKRGDSVHSSHSTAGTAV